MRDDDLEAEEPRTDEGSLSGGEPEESASSSIPDEAEPTKRKRWPWVFLGLIVILLALVGWNRTVRSDSFCARCHSMQAAADSAQRSAHRNVACITCHRGYGLKGAVLYIPTFLREVAQQFGGVPVADGVMDPAPCQACHGTVTASPSLLRGEHPTSGCEGCHGDPSHPKPQRLTVSPFDNPHPSIWVQIHGREAVENTKTCATCHLPDFCMATCHFKFDQEYPHPENWIKVHGPEQTRQGPEACTLCHPTTFCASCHGTEIPHASDWLETHYRQLQTGYPTAPCLLCHAPVDCNSCHVRHEVHNAQTIYGKAP